MEYFKPDQEDIRLGYECEIGHYLPGTNGEPVIGGFRPHVVESFGTEWGDEVIDIDTSCLRTPYLTAEQLEKEGWKKSELYNNPNRVPFQKGNYLLILDTRAEIPLIEMVFRDPSLYETVINPERFHLMMDCKCINTFRQICKCLNI